MFESKRSEQPMRFVDFESELQRLRRSRQLPAHLQDGIVETSVGSRQQLQVASEYRCSIFQCLTVSCGDESAV